MTKNKPSQWPCAKRYGKESKNIQTVRQRFQISKKWKLKASVRTDVRHMTCCQTLLMARAPSLFISCRLARSRLQLMCKDFGSPSLLVINHLRFVPGDFVASLQHMLCYRRTLQIVLLDVPLVFSQSLFKIYTQRFSNVDCVAFLARYPVNDPLT